MCSVFGARGASAGPFYNLSKWKLMPQRSKCCSIPSSPAKSPCPLSFSLRAALATWDDWMGTTEKAVRRSRMPHEMPSQIAKMLSQIFSRTFLATRVQVEVHVWKVCSWFKAAPLPWPRFLFFQHPVPIWVKGFWEHKTLLKYLGVKHYSIKIFKF